MLNAVGKIAMHTTITLGSAWLASITYCKVATYMNRNTNNNTNNNYKITKTGLGVSMLMGATIGLGSSIIFHSDNIGVNCINNMSDIDEIACRCSGK